MKIKKLLLFIMISIFCFIPVVNAKDDIEVKKVKVIDSSENVVVNAKDEIDVQFNDLEQTISYEVFIKNNTNKNLGVDNLVINGNSEEFLRFKLADNYDQVIISPNDERSVIINVSTEKVKQAGKNFDDTINLKFGFKEFIDNPYTSSNHIGMIILVILLSGALAFIMTKFNNNKLRTVSVIACFMILGVSSVFANRKEYSTTFSGSVKYISQNIVETSGTTISNYKVNYAASKDVWAYYDKVKNVYISSLVEKPKVYFKKFDLTNEDKNRVSAYLLENGDSNIPYDLYIMADGIIYANSNSSFLFSFPNIESINGLENIDFSNTTNMQGMFAGNSKLSKLDTKVLNMNKVTNTSYMFFDCYNLKVSKDDFDLTKVTTKNNMFVQYLSDVLKDNAQSDAKIDFSQISSSTNGQGVYLRSGTEKDKNPIYYYRGNVTNNNVKFAGFCWKMVRTTETGGVKLIYNGVPTSSGYCSNTGSYSQIGTSVFNSEFDSISYNGYMYGEVYNRFIRNNADVSIGTIFGNDVEYNNGKYKLLNTKVTTEMFNSDYTIVDKHHYTCFTSDSECENVYYVYYTTATDNTYYVTLTNGKKIDDILTESLSGSANENSSTIKDVIDGWYMNNMINYTNYLEDTIWCNDRSIYSKGAWDKDGNFNDYLIYSAYYKNIIGDMKLKPSLKCSGLVDSFTVDSKNGNGKLTYPVALLTIDEIILAGAKWNTAHSNFYLYTGQNWWTMSPSNFYFYNPGSFFLSVYSGYIDKNNAASYGVRPAISLKPDIDYVSGTGITTSPYVIR